MTSLILVQRDASQPTKHGFKITLEIGSLIHDASGYRFIPFTSARKPSRKSHKNMFKAIPRWADKLADAKGFGDLMTHDELKLAIIQGVR
jgi:hypothetical protein